MLPPLQVINMPKKLTAYGGIDALVHALESYVSIFSTHYTKGLAREATLLIFSFLPRAYDNGPNDYDAREHVHSAATIAGMAFANAFLGICHSMAHKLVRLRSAQQLSDWLGQHVPDPAVLAALRARVLTCALPDCVQGAEFHVPHGLANAALISHVIRYNATDRPFKQAAFPQYAYPKSKRRYAELADALGLGGATQEEKVIRLIEAVEDLKAKCDVPVSRAGRRKGS